MAAAPNQEIPQPAPMIPFMQENPMNTSASLYVGDLSPEVTEANLFDIFNNLGPVASIRVCRDITTRRSLGYAYVNFVNQTDAERALDTMNYTPIKGHPCRMMWSQRDPSLRKTGAGNVFCKNLDPSIDNKALYDTFSLYGEILSCKVVTGRDGVSKGYGFVHFETLESAEEAISKINGMLIAGKEVFVGRFVKRTERPGLTDWTNVFVKKIPLHWDKARLEDEFSCCGPIASSVIMLDENQNSRGFGFVDFVEHEGAVNACSTMHEKKVPTKLGEETGMEEDEEDDDEEVEQAASPPLDKIEEEYYVEKEKEKNPDGTEKKKRKPKKSTILYVVRAQKKQERERELSLKFEQMKNERINKFAGINCFIKNLHEDVDDEMLRREFSLFGVITSARIMREEKPLPEGQEPPKSPPLGPSKGFGFVCFSAPEEATRAVTEMNGKMICGKPIYVSLAQRKEARRAQLEAHHGQRLQRGGIQNFNGAAMYYGMPGQPVQRGGVNPYFQQPLLGQMGRGGMMAVQRGGLYRPNSNFQANANMYNINNPMRGGQRRTGGRQMNNRQRVPGQMPQMPQAQLSMGVARSMEPLTASSLANATEMQRKNIIGERLFPLIQVTHPAEAGKITGMLLEMDNVELLHLIESPEALAEKCREALILIGTRQLESPQGSKRQLEGLQGANEQRADM